MRTFYTLFTYVFGFVIVELPRVDEQPAMSYFDSLNMAISTVCDELIPNHARATRGAHFLAGIA